VNPIFDGVVVSAKSAPRLLAAIEEREARKNSPKAIAAKERAEKRRAEKWREERRYYTDLGIAPGSVTAQRLDDGDIDEDEAKLIAFKNNFRHKFTSYEEEYSRERFDELRQQAGHEVAREDLRCEARANRKELFEIPNDWQEYLRLYGFDSPTALALSATLKDSKACHPVWFAKAEIAVERADLDLDSLTYEKIKKAIDDWREERACHREWRDN